MAEKFITDRLEASLENIRHIFNLKTLDILDSTNANLSRIPPRAGKAAAVKIDRTGFIDSIAPDRQ